MLCSDDAVHLISHLLCCAGGHDVSTDGVMHRELVLLCPGVVLCAGVLSCVHAGVRVLSCVLVDIMYYRVSSPCGLTV